MNNFGVIEVAGGKTTKAPGWAYVPDVGPSHSQALQPANRKRAARNQAGLSLSDVSARQDAKIRKDLEALDRDTNKDVNISIPPKAGGAKGMTAIVYRVSQNTNHPNPLHSARKQQAHPERAQDLAVPEDVYQPPRRLPSPSCLGRDKPGSSCCSQPSQRHPTENCPSIHSEKLARSTASGNQTHGSEQARCGSSQARCLKGSEGSRRGRRC